MTDDMSESSAPVDAYHPRGPDRDLTWAAEFGSVAASNEGGPVEELLQDPQRGLQMVQIGGTGHLAEAAQAEGSAESPSASARRQQGSTTDSEVGSHTTSASADPVIRQVLNRRFVTPRAQRASLLDPTGEIRLPRVVARLKQPARMSTAGSTIPPTAAGGGASRAVTDGGATPGPSVYPAHEGPSQAAIEAGPPDTLARKSIRTLSAIFGKSKGPGLKRAAVKSEAPETASQESSADVGLTSYEQAQHVVKDTRMARNAFAHDAWTPHGEYVLKVARACGVEYTGRGDGEMFIAKMQLIFKTFGISHTNANAKGYVAYGCIHPCALAEIIHTTDSWDWTSLKRAIRGNSTEANVSSPTRSIEDIFQTGSVIDYIIDFERLFAKRQGEHGGGDYLKAVLFLRGLKPHVQAMIRTTERTFAGADEPSADSTTPRLPSYKERKRFAMTFADSEFRLTGYELAEHARSTPRPDAAPNAEQNSRGEAISTNRNQTSDAAAQAGPSRAPFVEAPAPAYPVLIDYTGPNPFTSATTSPGLLDIISKHLDKDSSKKVRISEELNQVFKVSNWVVPEKESRKRREYVKLKEVDEEEVVSERAEIRRDKTQLGASAAPGEAATDFGPAMPSAADDDDAATFQPSGLVSDESFCSRLL